MSSRASDFGETIFAIHYARGPEWRPGKPLLEQPFQPHHAYLQRLHEAGKLVFAGVQLGSELTGTAFVRASDLEEAKRVAADDPAVATGLFVASVRPWLAVFRGPGRTEVDG
jgi:uncharacterized protein YciI